MINTKKIIADYPLLKRNIHGKRIVYLDSTATALKPQYVIDEVMKYYTDFTANVFRGIYKLSEEATAAYEQARETVRRFIRAKNNEEVIFVRNTTEGLNLVAYSWFLPHVKAGDEVVASIIEHHSNFVPWQQMAKEKQLVFNIWQCDRSGQLDLKDLNTLITRRTKLLAITAVSNVVGTIVPIADVVKRVRKLNPDCFILVDGAQAAPHMPIDVVKWGADAVTFSGHKMGSPSGIGILWMKKERIDQSKPFLYGGDMIKEVHEKDTVFNDPPHKFEAGTPYIEGAIGIGAICEYLSKIGMKEIRNHEIALTSYALKKLNAIDGVTIYGPTDPKKRGGVIAFRLEGIHPHDVAQILDEDNICIRVGFHCAMPLHESLGIGATCRASFYLYNTKKDVDALVAGVLKVKKRFA